MSSSQEAEEAAGAIKRTPSQRQLFWARKHEKRQRYAHEHNKDPNWYQHKKHVLICSWAGRPIFTRYGDDSALAAFMGVISAIVSNFQKDGDTLRSIVAGPVRFVFIVRGPLYLVSVSKTSETEEQLVQQLDLVHSQILAVLTSSVHQILQSQPQYDIRNLMGGIEHLLSDLISDSNSNPAYLLNAVPCLRMDRQDRAKISSVLRKARTQCKSLLHGILLSGTKLVSLVRPKERTLHTRDLLLLVNFLTNSQSLRSSESWTPVCLPHFNDQGFLYAYVCFLSDEVCLALVTADQQGFFELKTLKDTVVEGFSKNESMDAIVRAEAAHGRGVDLVELDTSVPELRHFLYKSSSTSQFIVPFPAAPFSSKKDQKHLLHQYQRIHARLGDSQRKAHSIYYEVSDTMTLLSWNRPGEFEMYAAFTPLVSKEVATTACNRALRWIKREEESLFVFSF